MNDEQAADIARLLAEQSRDIGRTERQGRENSQALARIERLLHEVMAKLNTPPWLRVEGKVNAKD